MTIGQWWYRKIYLHSPAWKLTRLIRKRRYCEDCGSAYLLHLHHVDYRGYLWYNLIFPDLLSYMQTLCANHHRKAHERK